MLNSVIAVIAEYGYGELSVARITSGAGVSRRTFYDIFQDREDCFLAAFEGGVLTARELMLAEWAQNSKWSAQVRATLLSLLVLLDREPGLRSLLVVDALKAGPRVQQRRAEILGELSRALHESGAGVRPGTALPALTGEGVIGAVLGVIHTRLLAQNPGSMVELLNPLMGVIVLPYLGPAAAQRELACPAPEIARPAAPHRDIDERRREPLRGLPMRITYRTLLVLTVVGGHPGASNRQIADEAGVTDQGQMSKLLARLEGLGLIENHSPGQPSGEPNAWQLTALGQQVQQATEHRGEQVDANTYTHYAPVS
jgi:AcrR family transcriptional regulator